MSATVFCYFSDKESLSYSEIQVNDLTIFYSKVFHKAKYYSYFLPDASNIVFLFETFLSFGDQYSNGLENCSKPKLNDADRKFGKFSTSGLFVFLRLKFSTG